MKRICIHWTAGGLHANSTDIQHYHRMVEGDGAIVFGKFKPEANRPPLKSGEYAAHCGGGNSDTIGWALCGMAGFIGPSSPGDHQITHPQFEAACHGIAADCLRYGIPIDANHVYTHFEFGKRNPATSSNGKIDIIYLPPFPHLKPSEVGDFFRNKINWYAQKIKRKANGEE